MLHPLPKETVLEAKDRARGASRQLIALLVFVYIGLFNLAVFGSLQIFRVIQTVAGKMNRGFFIDVSGILSHPWTLLTTTTSIAIFLAVFHYKLAQCRCIKSLVSVFTSSTPPAEADRYHRRFLNILKEAEAATGIRPIQPFIVPDTGLNAFSLQNVQGDCLIGVTEGLLARLSRAELEAVIAHEAAHLAHRDSYLTTTVYSLTRIFVRLNTISGYFSAARYRIIRRGAYLEMAALTMIQALIWIVSLVGELVSQFLMMAISRQREYLADAHAVSMCKNPLALAGALETICGGFRGGFTVAHGLSSIFIMSPRPSLLEEHEGRLSDLLRTHPPAESRIGRLCGWAKSDLKTRLQPSDAPPPASSAANPTIGGGRFFLKQEDSWAGPLTAAEACTAGIVTPLTWLASTDTRSIRRASEEPEVISEIQKTNTDATAAREHCPRCRVALHSIDYEGATILHCRFCCGHLLRHGDLERIIARRETVFSEKQIAEVKKIWQRTQKGRVKDLCRLPHIECPYCKNPMLKSFHSYHTRIVIDRCTEELCKATWCDSNELEAIQIIVESRQAQ